MIYLYSIRAEEYAIYISNQFFISTIDYYHCYQHINRL